MQYRRLKPEELATVPGVDEIPPSMVAIGAVNDCGEVVGCVGIYAALHLDPLWIREDYRKSPFLIRRIWERLKAEMNAEGVHQVEVGMLDTNPGPENEENVVRIVKDLAGGEEVKGRIFVINLK